MIDHGFCLSSLALMGVESAYASESQAFFSGQPVLTIQPSDAGCRRVEMGHALRRFGTDAVVILYHHREFGGSHGMTQLGVDSSELEATAATSRLGALSGYADDASSPSR